MRRTFWLSYTVAMIVAIGLLGWAIGIFLAAHPAEAQMKVSLGSGTGGIQQGATADTIEVLYTLNDLIETDGSSSHPAETNAAPDTYLNTTLTSSAANMEIWGNTWIVPPDWDSTTDVSVSMYMWAQNTADGTVCLVYWYYPFQEDGLGPIYNAASDSLRRDIEVLTATGEGGDINLVFRATRIWLGAIPASELEVGDVVRFNVGRNPELTTDDYAGDMKLVAVTIRYVSTR